MILRKFNVYSYSDLSEEDEDSHAWVNSEEDWKPWDALFGYALVFVGHSGPNLGWLAPLAVVKAGPNLEEYAVVGPALQCAKHAGASTCAFLVTNDCSLSILEHLDFEEQLASLGFIL